MYIHTLIMSQKRLAVCREPFFIVRALVIHDYVKRIKSIVVSLSYLLN